ncbi:hypothetical protein [Polynucleobacter necessarius]|uniref:hypothetical protein n=1 Tax=Polynucleobacter necessarius TaxID=576610 RepID=UPI000E0935CD|nr:hypothetical protein [Polynucleobacter necessarius]HAT39473.1 hypothetical protein [Polynucleobacter sp.]
MKTLTAYRVSASLIKEKIFSKLFYIDESNYLDADEVEDAVIEMATESWFEHESHLKLECCHSIDSVDFYEVVKA